MSFYNKWAILYGLRPAGGVHVFGQGYVASREARRGSWLCFTNNSTAPDNEQNQRTVVVCTDLSGKEPNNQVTVGSMVKSGSLGGVMASTQARAAKDVGSISCSSKIFLIFITLTTLVP